MVGTRLARGGYEAGTGGHGVGTRLARPGPQQTPHTCKVFTVTRVVLLRPWPSF